MGGGGKGGVQTSEVKLPKNVEKFAEANMDFAKAASEIGYVPYQGNTVAALTPAQKSAMDMTSGALGAFNMGDGGSAASRAQGLDPYTGMAMDPTMTGGVLGYSPMGIYEDAKSRVAPAQRRAIDSLFIDPQGGRIGDVGGRAGGGGSSSGKGGLPTVVKSGAPPAMYGPDATRRSTSGSK